MTARGQAAVDGRGAVGAAEGEVLPISAVGLCKAYRNRTVLDGVDLHVGPGQVVGLLVPNGAGKTTTVKSLLGLVHLDGGTATVLGRPAGDPAARRSLGYLPEQFQYPGWLDNDTLERIGVAVSLVIPSDALWRGASYYLQSPVYAAATSVENSIPFAGNAEPSGLFIAWSVAYAAGWWLLADRWFRRRDL